MQTPKVCSEPGCIHDADQKTGRCATHAPPKRWSNSTRAERLDKGRWSSVRKRVLRRDKGMCRFCAMPAPQVDHRLPLAWGGAPYDMANLQSMCDPCHRLKTEEEKHLGLKLSRAEADEHEIGIHVKRWTP